MNDHLVRPFRDIHTAGAVRGDVTLHVVVSPAGVVESATAVKGPTEFFAAAETLERGRAFTPFLKDGKAVRAAGEDTISVWPLEQWGTRTPFPDVGNMATLRMTMTRSMCFGPCPAYTVAVRGDGAVEFEGQANVHAMGKRSGHISRDAVAEMLAAFRRADFFSLKDQYAGSITDMPSFTVSLEFDGRKKAVRDYLGLSVGMPEGVADLEEAFDRLAGTAKWLRAPGR
jgi:hypothetical protein